MNDVQLQLTADEAEALYSLLTDELPVLRYEVARTENREFRKWLADRRDRLEGICGQLEPTHRARPATAQASPDAASEPGGM